MECLISESHTLSDEALVAEVSRLAGVERCAMARLIATLAEFDARRLYLPAGCSSLFTYCTQVLHLSDDAAYTRIEAARAARRHPDIVRRLASGELTLTAVRLLASCLTPANHDSVLARARHLSKREVEHLVAELRPQLDVPAMVRKVLPVRRPTPTPATPLLPPSDAGHAPDSLLGPHGPIAGSTPTQPLVAVEPAPAPRAVVAPIAPERYKVQFTASRETYDTLRRAQALLRHVVPNGDPAVIFARALTLLVADLERRKAAAVKRPRKGSVGPSAWSGDGSFAVHQAAETANPSRHIPAAVRRHVWTRDDGRCAFVGTAGRCEERGLLEFHHVIPYADGGAATPGNIELRCRRHNRFEAERWFGEDTLPGTVRETAPKWAAPARLPDCPVGLLGAFDSART